MNNPTTLIVGIGSPHGDDRAGWLLADRLNENTRFVNVDVKMARSPVDLLDWLTGVERLMICDACRGLGCLGEFRRWTWPTPEIETAKWSGTHNLSLATVLALAQRLGHIPDEVVVWAIEGAMSEPTDTMSLEVVQSVERIVFEIVHEVKALLQPLGALCTNNR